MSVVLRSAPTWLGEEPFEVDLNHPLALDLEFLQLGRNAWHRLEGSLHGRIVGTTTEARIEPVGRRISRWPAPYRATWWTPKAFPAPTGYAAITIQGYATTSTTNGAIHGVFHRSYYATDPDVYGWWMQHHRGTTTTTSRMSLFHFNGSTAAGSQIVTANQTFNFAAGDVLRMGAVWDGTNVTGRVALNSTPDFSLTGTLSGWVQPPSLSTPIMWGVGRRSTTPTLAGAHVSAFWNRYRPQSFIDELLKSPEQLFSLVRPVRFGKRRVIILPSGAATGAYTIPATGGSYSITGTAATLKADRLVSAAVGSYSVSGTAATLARGIVMAGAAGSYSVSGTAASLLAARLVSADVGSYSISGVTVSLISGEALSAATGSYLITGTASSLEWGRVLSIDVGSYSLSGTAATLTYTPVGASVMPADVGSYLLTGTAATFKRTFVASADVGSYSVTGTAVGFNRGISFSVDPGSYTISGTTITFDRTYVLPASVGSYSLSGLASSLQYSGGVLTDSQKIALLMKILLNKQITDPATGLMTIYDDDDTTPLYTANIYEDAAGTTLYRGQGIERREKLSPGT